MFNKRTYTRRHLPDMSPRRVEKTTSGFTAATCMSGWDERRGVVEVRRCKTYADANACPSTHKNALTPKYMGYNWGWVCDEYSVPCVKTSYSLDDATLVKCCTGAQKEEDCDARYCPQSQSCRDFMIGKCDSDAAFLSADCQTWMNRAGNEDVRQAIMSKRCGSERVGFEGPCRKFCLDNDGQCDDAMRKYCASGITDLACACINSEMNSLNQTLAPVPCFDQKCVSGGYQTGDMVRISAQCPNYVDCRAVISSGDQATIKSSYIQQNCSAEIKSVEDAKLKEMADAEVARLRADEARGGAGGVPPAPQTKPPAPAESGFGAKFADVVGGDALFGDMSVGAVFFVFIVLVVLLGALYMVWTRRKAAKLAALMAAPTREEVATYGAKEERAREIREMIAELPPVGGL